MAFDLDELTEHDGTAMTIPAISLTPGKFLSPLDAILLEHGRQHAIADWLLALGNSQQLGLVLEEAEALLPPSAASCPGPGGGDGSDAYPRLEDKFAATRAFIFRTCSSVK